MSPTSQNKTKNLLEWTVFGFSGVLVLLIIITLSLAAVQVQDGPARLKAEAGTPVMDKGALRIPVSISNDGERVAANVEVRVSIVTGADRREAGFSVPYVPRGATRRGTVLFKGTQPPTDLECEVLGYEEP